MTNQDTILELLRSPLYKDAVHELIDEVRRNTRECVLCRLKLAQEQGITLEEYEAKLERQIKDALAQFRKEGLAIINDILDYSLTPKSPVE